MFFSYSLKMMSGNACGVSSVKCVLTDNILPFEEHIMTKRDLYACEIQIILVLHILPSLNLYTLTSQDFNIGKLAMR